MVHSLGIQVLVRDDGLHDLLHEVGAQLLDGDVLRVLDGDDHCVDAHGHTRTLNHAVFTRHLSHGGGARSGVVIGGGGNISEDANVLQY